MYLFNTIVDTETLKTAHAEREKKSFVIKY